jgi:cytoskeletal protein RodZ
MAKRLKELRQSSGVEIGDISRKTFINSRYLRAIEEGDFSVIPGDIYVRGYIKEFARCLGVPFREAIKDYENYLRGKTARDDAKGEASGSGFLHAK